MHARKEPLHTQHLLWRLIRRRPGITRSDLCRASGLAWGTVGYHVDRLARAGKVAAQRAPRSVHYRTRDRSCGLYLDALGLPATEAHRLLLALRDGGGLGPTEASRRLAIPVRRVHSYLCVLAESGFVESDGGYHPRFHAAGPLRDGRAPPPCPDGPGAPPCLHDLVARLATPAPRAVTPATTATPCAPRPSPPPRRPRAAAGSGT